MKRHLILVFALLASSVALNAVNSLPDDDKSDNKNKTELNSVVKKTWEFYSTIKQPSADALAVSSNRCRSHYLSASAGSCFQAASPLGQLHQALLYHRAVCLSAVDRALQRPYQPLVQCDFRSQRRNSDGNDTGTQ